MPWELVACRSNPAAAFRDSADPRDKLPPLSVRNHPAITEPRRIGELLRAIESYGGQPTTEAAMKFAPYVFVRAGELRAAEWSELDLAADEPVWRIPAARTKTGREHIVPLESQVVAVLDELHSVTGPDGLIFPSLTNSTRPMSENAITAALRRMGYSGDEMTWHGFRTIASTLLRELGARHRQRALVPLRRGEPPAKLVASARIGHPCQRRPLCPRLTTTGRLMPKMATRMSPCV